MQETKNLTIPEAIDYGVRLSLAGRHEEAVGLFRGVLMHEPRNFEAIEKLGTSLFELGKLHEAFWFFRRGRKIDRKHPTALMNYGLCLVQLGEMEDGLVEIEKAIACTRKHPVSREQAAAFYNNLGNTLERMRRYPDALRALETGIRFNPDDAFPHHNRGIVLLRLNRHREALAALDRSLELDPGNPDAIYNKSMAQLLLGDLRDGFKNYEARLTASDNKNRNFGLPVAKKWTGETRISGKTVLVYCEQGLGDDIQFYRFLPALRHAETIKIVTHAATKCLLPPMDNIEVIGPGEQLGDYDCWTALMSIPACLALEFEAEIPDPLHIDIAPEQIALWDRRLGPSPGLRRIGVCWSGNWQHKNDHNRSIDLDVFSALFDVPDCRFFALHHLRPGEAEAFAALQEKHGADRLQHIAFADFRDTAAAIANLDLVVTVDTSVAHLSATLGKPTWVLIPKFGTDWRWQLERSDTPWYPAARLIRQAKAGDWSSTLAGLRTELAASAAQQAAA